MADYGFLGLARRAAASLVHHPRYRLLWVSNLFFFAGIWTQTMVLGWLVYEITHSEFAMAVFTAARMAPMMLGPLSGVISDRFDRVRLLLIASVWAFGTMSVIASLVWVNVISYGGLVIGGLCIGMAQSPSQPARFTLVFDFVGRENLSNANALNSVVINMTQVIGPAIGGAMIVTFGVAVALYVSALFCLAAFLALWPLRKVETRHERQPEETLTGLLVTGFRAVLSNRLASSVLLITFAANFLLWPIYAGFMPVFAKARLGLDAEGLGWLLACSGAGGLVGSLTIAALGDIKFKGGLFVVGTALWGALWASFALSSSLPLSYMLMAGIGLAASPFGVMQTTLLLMMTEPRVQGRVMGLQELIIGITPLAAIVLGAAAELFGIATVAFVNGILLVLFLAGLAARVPALLRYGVNK